MHAGTAFFSCCMVPLAGSVVCGWRAVCGHPKADRLGSQLSPFFLGGGAFWWVFLLLFLVCFSFGGPVQVNASYMLALPTEAISDGKTIAVDFAREIGGTTAGDAMAVAVACSAFGALNGSIFGAARLLHACGTVKLAWFPSPPKTPQNQKKLSFHAPSFSPFPFPFFGRYYSVYFLEGWGRGLGLCVCVWVGEGCRTGWCDLGFMTWFQLELRRNPFRSRAVSRSALMQAPTAHCHGSSARQCRSAGRQPLSWPRWSRPPSPRP